MCYIQFTLTIHIFYTLLILIITYYFISSIFISFNQLLNWLMLYTNIFKHANICQCTDIFMCY